MLRLISFLKNNESDGRCVHILELKSKNFSLINLLLNPILILFINKISNLIKFYCNSLKT